jgi:hypothetical protein
MILFFCLVSQPRRCLRLRHVLCALTLAAASSASGASSSAATASSVRRPSPPPHLLTVAAFPLVRSDVMGRDKRKGKELVVEPPTKKKTHAQKEAERAAMAIRAADD